MEQPQILIAKFSKVFDFVESDQEFISLHEKYKELSSSV